ncbi:MAG: hypothetical protein ACTHJM_06165 [Marmoricola sp.]
MSVGRVALWVAEVGSVAAMVSVAAASASHVELWAAAAVTVLGSLAVVLPESEAGLLTLIAYGAWWFAVDGHASMGAVLAAAMAAMVFHVAIAHAAAAPPGAVTRLAVLRSLAVDVASVGLVTWAAAIVVSLVDGAHLHSPSFLIGVALVLVGALPWAAGTRGR